MSNSERLESLFGGFFPLCTFLSGRLSPGGLFDLAGTTAGVSPRPAPLLVLAAPV